MYVKLKLILVRIGIVLVSARDGCMVRAERTIGLEIILAAPDGTPRDEVKSKLISVHLDTVLISAQDRCTICAERTMAWKSFWAHPMVLLGDVSHVEARFGPFGDSVNLDA